MSQSNLGTIKAGQSKEFMLELPPTAKPGDEFWMKFEWTCGECQKHHERNYHVVLGHKTSFTFGCDCKTRFLRSCVRVLSRWFR